MALFKIRLLQQWRFHRKIFSSIADWTTYLYLFLPFGAFLFFLYKETILNGAYGFFHYVPAIPFIFLLLLLASVGYLRTFEEAADRLFLLQHQRTFRQLKRSAFMYSMFIQAVYMGLCLLALLPLLVHHYQFTTLAIGQIVCSMMLYFLVSKSFHFYKWIKAIVQLLVGAGLTGMVVYASFSTVSITILFIFSCIVYYEKNHIRSNHYFDQYISVEREAYYRWQARIFMVNPELGSLMPEKHTLKAPRFFKGRLFKRSNDATSELMLKTLIRNKRYRWGYVQLVGITIPLYFILPLWADMTLLMLSYYMLNSWLVSVMQEIKGHAVFKVLTIKETVWHMSFQRIKSYAVNYVLFCIAIVIILETIFS
ncbi:ABC transporter permease [Lysinibacillus sp. KU-BSD001]|uniref:ABC transporter permease n=1 Tax=Lysinibacillus sp. KU-BSD001 TaxID=3141328 RepID=UPI0036E470EE